MELFATEPISKPSGPESSRLASGVEAVEAAPDTTTSGDAPDAAPELEVSEYVPKRRGSAPQHRMMALTLLDGTTFSVPTRESGVPSEPKPGGEEKEKPRQPSNPRVSSIPSQLTARDIVSALRAAHHGADATEILGKGTDWQAMFAALLSLMLKKNMIADWEFVEELRNI
jgi:hypothetical protein